MTVGYKTGAKRKCQTKYLFTFCLLWNSVVAANAPIGNMSCTAEEIAEKRKQALERLRKTKAKEVSIFSDDSLWFRG